MIDHITLSCPACGARLQITDDVDRFACLYCGSEHIVRRGGGIVSLAPVVESLGKVQLGVDKTAAELAVARLTKEIEQLETELAQLEQMAVEEYAPPSRLERFLKVGGILSGFVVVSAFFGVYDESILPPFLLFIVFLTLYMLVRHQREKQANEELTEQAHELFQQLERKSEALNDNRRLVDGY